MNEKEGEEKTAEQTEDEAEKADHSCLDQHYLLDLPSEGPDGSEDSNVPLPFNDQCIQGIDDPEDGYEDCNQFKGVGMVKVWSKILRISFRNSRWETKKS